ncbi:sodium/glucose cotransporter 4-like [Liolophura sinensis]|uniref:sodium/glucose cotransporter 4-like n=1 Tax=Liolophura sinensis TaxID=3198878 RepID=UPI0031584A21
MDQCSSPRPIYTLHWGDSLTIGLYFLVVLIVGAWATFKAAKGNARGYFLAGKNMTWIPIGASIYASNIGAPLFIGLAGTAAASGIGGMIFEWHAIPFILALGWIFVPVFIASGVYTMPEYLKKRYGGKRLRIYLSVLSLVVYIITKISIEMYAGAVFVQMLFGWSMYLSGSIILIFSAAFTMTGGLTAVLYTDTLQAVVLTGGAIVLLARSLMEVGGYNALLHKYMRAVPNTTLHSNSTCGYPRPDSLSLLRDPVNSDYPWPGTLIINCAADVWFWCADQIMVQRSLSAKNLSHAKGGSILAGYLKILPFFLFILPGMASRVLFTDEVACVDPAACECICGNPAGCSNIAYPVLVLKILQPGIRGLMLAALFAACMSTLTSVFNSASSIFTMDLWTRCRKNASEWELLIVGRIVVLALVGCAILWIPIMQAAQGGELWQYWQMLMSCVGPPWGTVFILGFFWKRATEPGAFYGMIAGQLVGVTRLALSVVYPSPACDVTDDRPFVVRVHFLYVAATEIAVTATLILIISLFTPARPPEKLHRVTWWTRHSRQMPVDDDETDDMSEKNSRIKNDSTAREKPRWRSALEKCCGLSGVKSAKLTAEEMAAQIKRLTSIREKRQSRILLDINAVILLAVAVFLIGFYH